MRVLLTGSSGYVGSVLAPLLLEVGHEVVGCDTGLYRRCHFNGHEADIRTLEIDIRRLSTSDLAGFDAVVHLAGLSNDPLGDFRPELTYSINHQASVRLASLAVDAGVSRFVFASTCSVYGAAAEDWLNESSRLNPVTPYAVAKLNAERDIGALASETFSPTFVRAGTVYGVSPRIRFDLVLNNLVAWAASTGEVRLKSDGSAWRPLLHVEDLARVYVRLLAARREDVHMEIFNAGSSEENYRVRDIARIVKHTVPGCRIVFAPGAVADQRNYRVSCARMREKFPDFEPRWTVSDGARQLYLALERHPVPPTDFEGERYSRIAHLKSLLRDGRVTEDMYPGAGIDSSLRVS